MLDELDVRRGSDGLRRGPRRRRRAGISRAQLEAFTYDGEQLKLIDQSRGIRNPRAAHGDADHPQPAEGPYDDVETADGLLRYAYRTG